MLYGCGSQQYCKVALPSQSNVINAHRSALCIWQNHHQPYFANPGGTGSSYNFSHLSTNILRNLPEPINHPWPGTRPSTMCWCNIFKIEHCNDAAAAQNSHMNTRIQECGSCNLAHIGVCHYRKMGRMVTNWAACKTLGTWEVRHWMQKAIRSTAISTIKQRLVLQGSWYKSTIPMHVANKLKVMK